MDTTSIPVIRLPKKKKNISEVCPREPINHKNKQPVAGESSTQAAKA